MSANLVKAQTGLKWLWQSDKLTPEQDKELAPLIEAIDEELMAEGVKLRGPAKILTYADDLLYISPETPETKL